MTTVLGYLGIVVPERKFWQGYFIKDVFADSASDALKRVMANEALRTGSRVITKLDIPDQYQSVLGGFCATAVAASLGEVESEHSADSLIGACASVIRDIIKRDYFWIEGTPEPGGIRTKITPIYVSSVEEAKKVIESLTIVRKINRRLLASYVPEGQMRIH